jgi:hypothetical protein
MSTYKPKNFNPPKKWQYTLAFIWAVLVVPVAVLCIISIILFVPGVLLLIVGAWPIVYLLIRWSWSETAMKEYDEDGEVMEVPWMLVGEADVYEAGSSE